jgi:hypothetical protein
MTDETAADATAEAPAAKTIPEKNRQRSHLGGGWVEERDGEGGEANAREAPRGRKEGAKEKWKKYYAERGSGAE